MFDQDFRLKLEEYVSLIKYMLHLNQNENF